MKLALYLTSVLAGTTVAFPGIGELMRKPSERQAPNTTIEMIGDLVQGATTAVGNQVKNCLLSTGPCQDPSPKVCDNFCNLRILVLMFVTDIQSSSTSQPFLPQRHLLCLGLHLG